MLFLAIVLMAGIHFAQAQCAIYVCPNTGAWAGSYYDGNPPFLTMEQTKQEAKKECQKSGGTNCQYFFSDNCRDCWYAFIISNDGYTLNYYAVWSGISRADAEEQVRKGYRDNNGVAYSSARVTTWYVPK